MGCGMMRCDHLHYYAIGTVTTAYIACGPTTR